MDNDGLTDEMIINNEIADIDAMVKSTTWQRIVENLTIDFHRTVAATSSLTDIDAVAMNRMIRDIGVRDTIGAVLGYPQQRRDALENELTRLRMAANDREE